MRDKEVRGWGPVFTVSAHFENNLTLEQTLLYDRMKVSLSALHGFGEEIREQPNGNPVPFRIVEGCRGRFDEERLLPGALESDFMLSIKPVHDCASAYVLGIP